MLIRLLFLSACTVSFLTSCGSEIRSDKQEETGRETGEETGQEIEDRDGDGVVDEEDACPDDPAQWTDVDGDGVCDEVDDECPNDDTQWIDTDGDGVCDDDDDCPEDPAGFTDTDGDGTCDESDDCPEDDSGVTDTDGDGACDANDDCPDDPGGYADTNGDGVCDDTDDNDLDGIPNGEEGEYGDDCAISDPDVADTDEDGIPDNEDAYPRDPYAEFILFGNDWGTIDLALSNRDGTFQTPVSVAEPYGDTSNADYRYTHFVISDFDNDGKMDFLALGNTGTEGEPYDIWWFWREKADELQQRLVGTSDVNPFGTVADLDNDDQVDLLGAEIERPNYIDTVIFRFYGNQDLIHSADCFATADASNPDGCAFVSRQAVDLTGWAGGQWVFKYSRDAVDVGNDGHRDLAVLRISSGGNTSVPITIVHGNGDGTFTSSTDVLVQHNSGGCGSSPANSLLLADFDGDNFGDVITGLDDDGDAGSAWFYPGTRVDGAYALDSTGCIEAFDINTADESGSDNPGTTSSARNFDFNFDGIQDVMLGYRYQSAWSGSSRTVLLLGLGDGTFGPPVIIRDFQDTNYGSNFAIPQRLCARFPIE